MNRVLEINNLSKNFYTINEEIIAIQDITLNIYENDFVAIIGPSGCGKSTLLSILNKQENYSIDGILSDNNRKALLRDALKIYAERAKNRREPR